MFGVRGGVSREGDTGGIRIPTFPKDGENHGPRRRAVPAWAFAAGIAVIFFGLVGYAKITGHWNTELPKQVYFQLVPTASEQAHP